MTEQSLFWTTNDTGDGVESGYTATQWFALWRSLYTGHTTNVGGVAPNYANQLAVSGSTSPVSVATGAALVYGIPFFNDAVVTVAIATPVTQVRIDRIVLRATWAAQTVRIVRIAGTEGASEPPNLVQSAGSTWDIPLARVSITPGGSITLTDEREYLQMVAPAGVGTTQLASSAITTAKISDNAATNAKLADMTQTTIKGRAAGSGTGDPVDLTAAQVVAIVATADGTGSGLDADTLDGVQGSGYALAAHTHSEYAAISHTHSTYAAIDHLHTGVYAMAAHNHDSTYAVAGHNHDSTYAATVHTHSEYAAAGHNHDSTYAATSHTHSGYAALSHNHDGVYSPTLHTHSSYAAISHNHDGTYSPTSHTHSGYAALSHTHDGTYSPTVHTHSEYAAVTHNHDGVYSPTSHTHSGYAATSHNHDGVYAPTSHTHGTSGIDNSAITNAKLANMSEARVKGRAAGAGSGDPVDLTASQLVTIATTGDGSGSGLDADTLDGKHASEFAVSSHNHDGTYAATSHNHDGVYSPTTHTHSEYAATTHDHDATYAATTHNHDSVYAATSHNHDGVYAPTSHTHGTSDITDDAITNAKLADMAEARVKGRAASAGTGDPSDLSASQLRDIVKLADGTGSGLDADTLDGVHASGFSLTSHTHSTYAAISHTHSAYAAVAHNHDSTYAATSHTHSGYALVAHNHDGDYATASHTHAAEAAVSLSVVNNSEDPWTGSASARKNLSVVTVSGTASRSNLRTGDRTLIQVTNSATLPKPAVTIYGVAIAQSDGHLRQITAFANAWNSLTLSITNPAQSVTYQFSITYIS
jgi:hypothetical protein